MHIEILRVEIIQHILHTKNTLQSLKIVVSFVVGKLLICILKLNLCKLRWLYFSDSTYSGYILTLKLQSCYLQYTKIITNELLLGYS